MPENNYAAMADLFSKTFDSRKVAVFPVDHGGAKQALKLRPYLQGAGVNFVMYERKGAKRQEENCLDQGNLYFLDEVREMVTPRRRVKRFLRNVGEVDDIVLLDDWATSRTMPSIGGAWVYFVMLGYPEAKTAAFIDYCGGVDLSPDRQGNSQYGSTREYIRQHDLNATYYLLANGLLPFEGEDALFAWMLERSSRLERARLYVQRRADQVLITPLARRLRRRDFAKAVTDSVLKTAAIL